MYFKSTLTSVKRFYLNNTLWKLSRPVEMCQETPNITLFRYSNIDFMMPCPQHTAKAKAGPQGVHQGKVQTSSEIYISAKTTIA